MDLREDLKLLFLIGDDEERPLLFDSEIDTAIKRARLLDAAVAWEYLDYCDDWASEPEVDAATGIVTFTLRDIFGDRTQYAHFPAFYVYGEGRAVSVAEGTGTPTAIEPADYGYDELSMTASFDEDFVAQNVPVVRLRGHLVDYTRARRECCERVLHRIHLLPNVRGREFSELADRITRMRDDLYGGAVLRRGS